MSETQEKYLGATNFETARAQVKDIEVFGDPDSWKLLSKASSKDQGWMKSTKLLEISGVGVLVQVSTQQRNPDGSYSVAEAVTFVPKTRILETTKDGIIERKIGRD
jgi:hypothetical protein